MKRMEADVVVIGGGATGTGCARDAAMRGYSVIMVDRADIGQGTSGRYHGLLHSGGRYVVSDPRSATECAEERDIVARIHADAVEETGGLFVATPGDPMDFTDKFAAGAVKAKVPCEEIPIAKALELEPRLNPGITRAFRVHDGTVDGWQMMWGAANSAKEYGAQILTYTTVTGIETENEQVKAVICQTHDGEELRIDTSFVLNAAGPWSGHVAEMAGCHDVEVVAGRGIMIAMNHRLVNHVINRCIYPADGDILVPVHTVSIIGTTDQKSDDADKLAIPFKEVQQMLDSGETLIPGFRTQRACHAWAGARPLVKDKRVAAGDTRHMSRGMSILDHAERDGLKGLITISGGKLTTYRLMAKNAVDEMERQTGNTHPCRTADEAVPGSKSGKNYLITHRLGEREHDRLDDPVICECELMTKSMFVDLMKDEKGDFQIDDLRRQLRIGMGPCQGGFCSMRAAGLTTSCQALDAKDATRLLRLFLKNRWIGLWPILFGNQVNQTALDNWIFHGLFDIDHLPDPGDTGPAIPDLSDTDAMEGRETVK